MSFVSLPATGSTTTSLAATAITVTPSGNQSSSDAQAAINELQGDIDTRTTILSKTSTQMHAPLAGTDGDIIYVTDYKAHFRYSGNRWSLMGKPDPRYGYSFDDEFVANATSGSMAWNTNGTTVVSAQASASHPGVYTYRQATGGAFSRLGLRADAIVFTSGSDFYVEWLVLIPTLATVAEDFCFSCGFNDLIVYDANNLGTDGAYFTYNRAVNGANWNTHTVQAGTATNTTNLTSAIVANTWYRLGILVRGTSTVDFYVDGTNVKQHTTNIPSGAARATGYSAQVSKTNGSANADFATDYASAWAFFTTPRAT